MGSTTIMITDERLSSFATGGSLSEDIGDNEERSPLQTQRKKIMSFVPHEVHST